MIEPFQKDDAFLADVLSARDYPNDLHLWWLGFPAGVVLHATAVVMSKRDPHWFDIFRRHLRQPTHLDS